MELKIQDYVLPVIHSNYEDIKAELIKKTEDYKNIVYTENDIKAAKADRAELNKLKKSINDERLSRQKEYMKPFDLLKAQMDELIKIIDEPVKVIDEQIKAYESKQKEIKEQACRDLFDKLNTLDWLLFDQIFDTKWTNASTSMSSIEDEMKMTLNLIRNNLDSLNGLEYSFEAKEMYKNTLSLSQAINENTRLIDLAKKKAAIEPKAEPIIAPTEPAHEEARQWMELKVKINSNDFDALQAWLEGRGIEWEIK